MQKQKMTLITIPIKKISISPESLHKTVSARVKS